MTMQNNTAVVTGWTEQVCEGKVAYRDALAS